MMQLSYIFDGLEMFSTLIPLVMYFVVKPKMQRWLKYLLFYCTINIAFAVYATVLYSQQVNNIQVYLAMNMVFFFCSILAIDNLINQQSISKIIRVILPLTTLIFVANAIWGEGKALFNSRSITISNIIIIILCLYYYRYSLKTLIVKHKNTEITFIEREPSFWIISGLFVYCGGIFFLYSFYSSITISAKDFANTAWNLNDVLLFIMNVSFAKGIKCLK